MIWTFHQFCFMATLLFFVCKWIIYPFLRKRAWEVSVILDPFDTHPGYWSPEWNLWARSPGYDPRGVYMLATHTPLYVFKMAYALLSFPYKVFQLAHVYRYRLDRISDKDVFNVCTRSSLVIMGAFDSQNHFVLEFNPKHTPYFEPIADCDPSSLTIVFLEERIVHATSKFGQIHGNPLQGVSRNEVLVVALRNIIALWVHPTVHVNAEKSALEIQAKRVWELEPSCHFVSSLHDGLLHGPMGPLVTESPFYSGGWSEIVHNCFSYPMPRHAMHANKEGFEMYHFLLEGRKTVFKLVQQMELKVNAEHLFLNVIMHEIDHTMLWETLSSMPLLSADGTGSWRSRWQNHSFVTVWMAHWDNPCSSDLVVNHVDKAFYNALYREMVKVNKHRADKMVVSCCF